MDTYSLLDTIHRMVVQEHTAARVTPEGRQRKAMHAYAAGTLETVMTLALRHLLTEEEAHAWITLRQLELEGHDSAYRLVEAKAN